MVCRSESIQSVEWMYSVQNSTGYKYHRRCEQTPSMLGQNLPVRVRLRCCWKWSNTKPGVHFLGGSSRLWRLCERTRFAEDPGFSLPGTTLPWGEIIMRLWHWLQRVLTLSGGVGVYGSQLHAPLSTLGIPHPHLSPGSLCPHPGLGHVSPSLGSFPWAPILFHCHSDNIYQVSAQLLALWICRRTREARLSVFAYSQLTSSWGKPDKNPVNTWHGCSDREKCREADKIGPWFPNCVPGYPGGL